MKKTLFICETTEEANEIAKRFRPELDTVFALSFQACTELSRWGLPFVEPRDVPTLGSSLQRSRQGYERSCQILELLCQSCVGDDRFDSISVELIDAHLYLLKIAIDQSILIIECVGFLLEAVRPERVIVPKKDAIRITGEGLIDPSVSITSALLSNSPMFDGIELGEYSSYSGQTQTVTGTSFGQVGAWNLNFSRGMNWPRRLIRRELPRHLARLASEKLGLLIAAPCRRFGTELILSLNSKEVHRLRSAGRPRVIVIRVLGSRRRHSRMIEEVSSRTTLQGTGQVEGPTTYRGVSLSVVVDPIIDHIVRSVVDLRGKLRPFEKLIRKLRPSLIVIDSLSPFNRDAPILRIVASKLQLRVACWMHGGYGAYESLAGYEVTDLRLGKAHFVYGPAVRELLEELPESARDCGAQAPSKVIAVGTPYFERLYAGSQRTSRRSERLKVLFCLGHRFTRNQFSFGYERPGIETGLWRENILIAKMLSSVSHKVDVVIKDYPFSPDREYWSRFAEEHGVEFLSGEVPFDEVLKSADCVVLTWISTTFYQALLAKMPILLWDNSDLTPSSKKVLLQYPGYREEVNSFCELAHQMILDESVLGLESQELARHFLSRSDTYSRQELLRSFQDYSTKGDGQKLQS